MNNNIILHLNFYILISFFTYSFQYGHVSELDTKKMRDEEQQNLELFNLETAKLRVLRNAQHQEELDRIEKQREKEVKKTLEETTSRMNSIIEQASKEDREEDSQVINNRHPYNTLKLT